MVGQPYCRAEQKSVDFTVSLLQECGPTLKMPHSSGVETSRHPRMRELRIQHEGRPYRVLYAFDPRWTAMLLIGGDKTGNNRWHEEYVPIADAIYDRHCGNWRKTRRRFPSLASQPEELSDMARNFKELQAKMDRADRADNAQRVREELQRMALEDLRGAKQLTQSDMAEMLNVPQSSISRIEQRADMYLSTLRNYIHAVGGELRIQAVFPDGATVVIDRFGDYEERPYVVEALAESRGVFRLRARPLHHQGAPLSTKPVRASGLTKAMRALHLPEVQIASVKASLETNAGRTEIGGSGSGIERVFSIQDLVAAGFDEADTD